MTTMDVGPYMGQPLEKTPMAPRGRGLSSGLVPWERNCGSHVLLTRDNTV